MAFIFNFFKMQATFQHVALAKVHFSGMVINRAKTHFASRYRCYETQVSLAGFSIS